MRALQQSGRFTLRLLCYWVILSWSGALMFAWQGPPPRMGEPDGRRPPPPVARQNDGPPGERGLHVGPPGRWWNDATIAEKLALSTDQQKRMDALLAQSRMRLIDLNAALQKQEASLDTLLQADQVDSPKAIAQLDRVAEARAELEKANGRYLLGLRTVLSPDQWKKLSAMRPEPPPH